VWITLNIFSPNQNNNSSIIMIAQMKIIMNMQNREGKNLRIYYHNKVFFGVIWFNFANKLTK